MERDYDIFEILPDGAPLWKQAISGHTNAVQRLEEIAAETKNEVRVMCLATKNIYAAIPARA